MADEQDRSEALDDDKLTDEYPPEEPLGVDEYGTTDAEQAVDEPIEERVAREEPDRLRTEKGGDADEPEVLLLDNTVDAEVASLLDEGETGDSLGPDRGEPDRGGPLDDDPDRVPAAAEEAAVHVVEEP